MILERTHKTPFLIILGGMIMSMLVACNGGDTGDGPQASTASNSAPSTKPPAQSPANTANATQGSPTAQVPPIVVMPEPVNFGVVQPGSTLETEVTLTNTSDRPLTIVNAKPSCTCTTVDLAGKVVPARGSITVPVSMKTNRSIGIRQAVVQMQVAGYGRFAKINLVAENSWGVRSIPSYLPLRESRQKPEQLTGTVVLEAVDKKPFSVIAIMGLPPEFIGFDPGKDAPRNQYRVRYDFSNVSCDSIPPYWIVRTDHPKAELFDVRVRHDPCTKVVPRLPMSDFRSSAGVISSGTMVPIEIVFKKLRRPITTVTSSNPLVTAFLSEEKPDGKDILITAMISVDPETPKGLFQTTLIFGDGTESAGHLCYGWVE
jgi:hypothetical protein